ncbi:hypothetical protein CLOLEP_00234 [[Clostridium] leptum DSM 753]|uniref:Uncharacterized protein n=1 Tax=[Clostridium] leptum DSM 753 TaxID=428125 RepID=A7VNV8_9FIRM|nr:hypothetical protein CLOLEP_00234 [[Clostridium] leptum DSM 753]
MNISRLFDQNGKIRQKIILNLRNTFYCIFIKDDYNM